MKTGEDIEESAYDMKKSESGDVFMDEPIGTYKSPVNESIETIDTDEHIFV
jgi:hypothetical protein